MLGDRDNRHVVFPKPREVPKANLRSPAIEAQTRSRTANGRPPRPEGPEIQEIRKGGKLNLCETFRRFHPSHSEELAQGHTTGVIVTVRRSLSMVNATREGAIKNAWRVSGFAELSGCDDRIVLLVIEVPVPPFL